MKRIQYNWNLNDRSHAFELVFVPGTHGKPYQFGEGSAARSVEIPDFFIGSVPVTQALWTHVLATDANPAARQGPDLPIENVSWDEITGGIGFLDQINASPARATVLATLGARAGTFRLPSETEWEYAARGWTSLARRLPVQRQ